MLAPVIPGGKCLVPAKNRVQKNGDPKVAV
jgi:hypothetical protein